MVVFETKIKELCRLKGITQKQLYEAIGVTDAGMRKMYARNSCEVALLEKIAGYFNVPITDFLGGEKQSVTNIGNGIISGYGSINNDSDAISRLVSLLEEKDKQINQLLQILASK